MALSSPWPFHTCQNDLSTIILGTERTQVLLIYLALGAGRRCQRELTKALVWPDYSLKPAQQNMRQALFLPRREAETLNFDIDPILADGPEMV